MKNSWRVACIAGVDINVHWSFSFIILWMIWHSTFGQRELASVIFLSAAILLLFGCVLLHELGHALIALQLDVVVKKIVILPVGGMAQIESAAEKPVKDLLITAAGPMVNFGLMLGAALGLGLGGETRLLAEFVTSPGVVLTRLLQTPAQHGILTSLIAFLLLANGVLFVFNLIPAIPMDGGRILRAFLAMFLPYPEAAWITKRIGQVIAILLVFWAFQSRNVGLLFMATFVFLTALSMGGKPSQVQITSRRFEK